MSRRKKSLSFSYETSHRGRLQVEMYGDITDGDESREQSRSNPSPGVTIDLDGGKWPQREGVGIARLILNARRTTCSLALHFEQVFVRTA